MSAILSIALSGLDAARQSLAISADNVANAESDGALPNGAGAGAPAPYQPLEVVQQPLPGGGTRAAVTPLDPTYVAQFAPELPFADQQGLVAAPNVDLATERVDQLAAINAYRANLRVIEVAQELDRETLDALGPKRDLSA